MSPRDLVVGKWGARFLGRGFACAVGRGGIGEKLSEGDGVTPAGRHRIEAVWHRPDRAPAARVAGAAAAAFAARVITPRIGWSDDPADPGYNGPIRRPHVFSHERLARPDPLYDLVAVLDWNRTPAIPGRGSAIFLHVWRSKRYPTEGCIAFARADLAWILARWTLQSRVVARSG